MRILIKNRISEEHWAIIKHHTFLTGEYISVLPDIEGSETDCGILSFDEFAKVACKLLSVFEYWLFTNDVISFVYSVADSPSLSFIG